MSLGSRIRTFPLPVQMLLNMQRAAPRRANDVIEIPEVFYEQIVATLGQVFETRVGHGLSAAGLVGGITDRTSVFLQQLQGGDACLRIELVYITRYKKAYFHL